MSNRFIDREGIFEEETSAVVKANDLSRLEKQNQALQEEIALVKQSSERISKELSGLRRKYDDLFEGKGFMRLLSSLAKKQKEMAEVLEKVSDEKFDMILRHDPPLSHA